MLTLSERFAAEKAELEQANAEKRSCQDDPLRARFWERRSAATQAELELERAEHADTRRCEADSLKAHLQEKAAHRATKQELAAERAAHAETREELDREREAHAETKAELATPKSGDNTVSWKLWQAERKAQSLLAMEQEAYKEAKAKYALYREWRDQEVEEARAALCTERDAHAKTKADLSIVYMQVLQSDFERNWASHEKTLESRANAWKALHDTKAELADTKAELADTKAELALAILRWRESEGYSS